MDTERTMMTLDQTDVGQSIRICDIPDSNDMLTLLRLGFSQGSLCTIRSKIPGGPLVIQQGMSETALGRALCQRILVEREPFH